MRARRLLGLLLLCSTAQAGAQEVKPAGSGAVSPGAAGPDRAGPGAAPVDRRAPLRFAEFLSRVARGNLDLLAQQKGVPLAEAQVALARVFPDPTLSGGLAAVDISRRGQPTSLTLQVGGIVELGGKRGARVTAAQAEVGVAQAQLEEFLRGLRGGAAGAFITVLYAQHALQVQHRTQESLEALVRLHQQRLRLGDVGELALVQARVAARRHQAEVLTAEVELQQAELALALLLGSAGADLAGLRVTGDLRVPVRSFVLEELLESARARRPDLLALRRGVAAAEARVRLARANRVVDVSLGVGATLNLRTEAEDFRQEQNATLNATLGVPLPFSRIYRGELQGAQATQAQRKAESAARALQVEVELRQSLVRYRAAAARVALYDQGLLKDAERVQQATLYTYQKGGATLLEVLAAQRTLDELQLSYYEALAEHARSLVAVELAAGRWDVPL